MTESLLEAGTEAQHGVDVTELLFLLQIHLCQVE